MNEEHAENLFQKLLTYAFRILGMRDFSLKEMKQRLATKASKLKIKNPEEIFEKVLNKLKELDFLNDEKFCRLYIHSELAINPKGKYAMQQKLKQKGIGREIFEKIWDEVGMPDEKIAEQILERKKRLFSRLSGISKKKKIMVLLGSRGIKSDVIYSYFSSEKGLEKD